jgi:hypothetical protein
MHLNLSDKFVNSVQTNNLFTYKKGDCLVNYAVECNVTALTYVFEMGGWIFPSGKYKQPEDNLANSMINSKLVESYYKEHFYALWKDWNSGKKDAYTPLEIHKLLELGVNEWFKCEADTFYSDYPIIDFLKQIYFNRLPVMTSGTFGNYNHCVAMVGLDGDFTEQQFEDGLTGKGPFMKPNFIYDDPWYRFNQETKTFDKTKSGNDSILTWDQFVEEIKPLNSDKVKFAHIIRKPLAVV